MIRITQSNIQITCDECGIVLQDNLTLEDINKIKCRYNLCNECESKINGQGFEV